MKELNSRSENILKKEELLHLKGGTAPSCSPGWTHHVCRVNWYYGGQYESANACIPNGTSDDCEYVEGNSGVYDCDYCVEG